MVRLLFNEKTKKWDELDKEHPKEYEGSEKEINMDGLRRKYLDQIKGDLRNDLDHVEVICGGVGTGKSTLGRLDCRYVSDEKFHPRTHVIRNERDIKRVIQGVKKREAILIDEGSMIFAAVETMSRKQKYATLILDVVRQRNLLIVVCAPAVHRLSSSLVIDRAVTVTRTYIHSKNHKKGRFAFYGMIAKEKLYRFAKKNHGSLKGSKPNYRGRFPEDKTHTEEYIQIKDETLNLALDSLKFDGDEKPEKEEIKPLVRQEVVRDYQHQIVKNNMDRPLSEMMSMLGVSQSTISRLREKIKGAMTIG